jgi:cysteine-rich repeat protein
MRNGEASSASAEMRLFSANGVLRRSLGVVLVASSTLFLVAPSSAHALCSGALPNGVGNPGEQCDDGNLDTLDGCSNTCVENPGYTCSCPAGQLTGVTVDDPQTLLAIIGGNGG